MNEMEKILKKRKKLQARMQKLLDSATDSNLSTDDTELYNKYDRQFEELGVQLARLKKLEERERELDEPERKQLVGGSKEEKPFEMTDDEVKRFSLWNAVRYLMTGDEKIAKYELEISERMAKETNVTPNGILIPRQVQQRATLTKENSGALVGTDHRADLYIDSLQAESFVVANGAKVLRDLVGDQDIPRALGGIDFQFVGEGGKSPETSKSSDNLTLTPHTATGSISITRRLLKQSNPYVEQLIEADINAGMALLVDKMVLAGDGLANKPKGILYTTGVNTVSVEDADGIPTFAEAVKFETEVAENDALRGNLCYVTRPAINGAWKTIPTTTNSGVMVNTKNEVNGYKSIGTTLLPAGKTIFGNMGDVVIGFWGGLDLVLDTATLADEGGIVLRAWQDMDVGVRHAQSFSITGE